jgi:hypothetical protein
LGQVGIDADDPRSTWRHTLFPFAIQRAPGDEATAGNPIHLLLIVASSIGLVAWTGASAASRPRAYGLSLALAFLLLCLLFKWRPFLSHWQLPLFVLSSPLVGLFVEARPRLFALSALFMAIGTLPFLLLSRGHPLVGDHSVLRADRLDQTFRQSERLRSAFIGAAQTIRSVGCSQVGLSTPWWGIEYPLWASLPELRADGGRLEHVGVTNVSARLESHRPDFSPCAIVTMSDPPATTLTLGERTFGQVWANRDIGVLLEEPGPLREPQAR